MWRKRQIGNMMTKNETVAWQWVGLTDEEFEDLVEDEDWFNDPVNFAKIIQAKLKEKNNG
jgi:hypothetical protein